jgi:hypothetical protein
MKCPSCHKEIPDSSLICIFCNAVFSTDGKIIAGSKSATLRAGKIKYRIIITVMVLAVIFIFAAAITIAHDNKKKTIASHHATCYENIKNISTAISIYVQDSKNSGNLPPADTNWTSLVTDTKYLTCPATGLATGAITYGYNGNIGGKSILSSFSGDFESIPMISECNNTTHLIMKDADVIKNRHMDDKGVAGYFILTLSGSISYAPSTAVYNWDKLSFTTPAVTGNEGATTDSSLTTQPTYPTTTGVVATPTQTVPPVVNTAPTVTTTTQPTTTVPATSTTPPATTTVKPAVPIPGKK